MGALVGVMVSRFLDGFEVTDLTRELLTANGWTEQPISGTAIREEALGEQRGQRSPSPPKPGRQGSS